MRTEIILLLTVGSLSVTHAATTNTVLCYYSSWAQLRGGLATFRPSDIPAGKCSHIVYAFLRPTADGGIKQINDPNTFGQLVALKAENSNLKVLVSVGGWAAGSENFSTIVGNETTRDLFILGLSFFVNYHQLDGIDIDWEYPNERGGDDSDYQNFVTFVRDLRSQLGPNKTITAAVGKKLQRTYDVQGLNQYLDYFNLMTYNYHSYLKGNTGQQAPLYNDDDNVRSVNTTVTAWINAGATPSKILLGLYFSGKTYQLSNPDDHVIGAPSSGPGDARKSGSKTYRQICMDLQQGGWTTVRNDRQHSQYSYKGNEWIDHENEQSIMAKTQYAVDKRLGGVMMWAVDHDDLHNVCETGSMPLLSAINRVIRI